MTVKNIWLSFFVLLSLTLNSQVTELWNVSPSGGLNQHGLIYKVNGDGSGFEELVSMDSLNADNLCSELTLSQGYVYGFAYQDSTVFLYRINTSSHQYERLADLPFKNFQSRQFSHLTYVGDKFYFFSRYGANTGNGGIFTYDPMLQTIQYLVSPSTQTGFFNFTGRMVHFDGGLYGISNGGQFNMGNIFKYDINANLLTAVYHFGGTGKAAYPITDLIAIDNYNLLGFSSDTSSPLNLNSNFIYLFNIAASTVYEWRSLSNLDGTHIARQIALGTDGFVYASARHGGAFGCAPPKDYGCGTLIRYRPSDNTFEKLYDFYNPSDGTHWSYTNYNYFNSGLTFGYDGNVYSTAGNSADSYAYSFNITTKVFTNILSNYLKTPPLTPSGYYNFVNVTNGYLNVNSESISNIDIKVYPNPATQLVNIELRTEENLGVATFEIFDLVGRRQYKSSYDEKLFQVNVEGLTDGLYCWKYSTAKGIKTGKLLIATHD